MNRVQFNINEIGENGFHLKTEQPNAFLNDISGSLYSFDNIEFISNVLIDVDIYKENKQIVLNGNLYLKYKSPCSRCLEDVSQELNPVLNLILVPESNDKEFEFENDTIVCSYSGNTIDITDYLSEVVSLSLPVKILCDEKCKGLCSNCGTDLNKEKCECSANRITPEFAILQNYKI